MAKFRYYHYNGFHVKFVIWIKVKNVTYLAHKTSLIVFYLCVLFAWIAHCSIVAKEFRQLLMGHLYLFFHRRAVSTSRWTVSVTFPTAWSFSSLTVWVLFFKIWFSSDCCLVEALGPSRFPLAILINLIFFSVTSRTWFVGTAMAASHSRYTAFAWIHAPAYAYVRKLLIKTIT